MIPEKPGQPQLQALSTTPVDGGLLALTCSMDKPELYSYQFLKDGVNLTSVSPDNQHNVHVATNGSVTNNGNYTCKAYLGGVASVDSKPVNVRGKHGQ